MFRDHTDYRSLDFENLIILIKSEMNKYFPQKCNLLFGMLFIIIFTLEDSIENTDAISNVFA